MSPSRLGQKPRLMEGGDDPVNQVRHFMECFANRPTLDNTRFGERYLESELLLLVRFVVGAKDEEFLACFEREPRVGGAEKERHFEIHRHVTSGNPPHPGEHEATKVHAPN